MKNLFKAVCDFLELPYFFMDENECILRFCHADKRFCDISASPLYFNIMINGAIVGSIMYVVDVWIISFEDQDYKVFSVRELKSLLKKHAK